MDIAAIFLTLAILVLVAIYLYAPLARRYARPVTEEEHELSALMAERDRVINSLQELDFDFGLGKIPSEDYPTQRTNLLQKGADILRKIDALTSGEKSISYRKGVQKAKDSSQRKEKNRDLGSSGVFVPGADVAAQNAEDRIEEAISARRADASIAKRELADEDIESMISARRMKRKEKSAGFCPKCGKPVMFSDRFCPSCGKSLA
jgi:rubrerythrin